MTEIPASATTSGPAPVTAPPTRRRAWIAGLEGPRGLAAICVVVVHVAAVHTPWIVDATRIDFLGQALTFFFVLSGFLLYLPYVTRAADGKTAPPVGRYFLNRVRRVFPAYLVIFLLVNFVLRASYTSNPVTLGWDRVTDGTGTISDPARLLAHLTLTQSYFPSTLQTGINPAWSLTTEWGFYLVLPVAGWLLFRSVGDRPLAVALVPAGVMVGVGLLSTTVVGVLQTRSDLPVLEQFWGANWYAVLSRSFLAFADTFGWGMAAAVVYAALVHGAWSDVSTRRVQVLFGAATAMFLGASIAVFLLDLRYTASVFAVAAACFILTIVAPLGRGEPSPLASVTDWSPLRFIGMISLSSYLWHYPVIIVLERWGLPVPPTVTGLIWGSVVVLAVTFALGAASYYLIERTAMRWRT